MSNNKLLPKEPRCWMIMRDADDDGRKQDRHTGTYHMCRTGPRNRCQPWWRTLGLVRDASTSLLCKTIEAQHNFAVLVPTEGGPPGVGCRSLPIWYVLEYMLIGVLAA
jgi:hypothetical protein